MATVLQKASTSEEARVHAIFQAIVFVLLCVCLIYTLVFNYIPAIFDDELFGDLLDNDLRTRNLIFLVNNTTLCASCIACLSCTRRYGTHTKLKAGFVIILICWSAVAFANDTNAEIFRLTTLGLDCILFLGTIRDSALMDGLAFLTMVWFVTAVTLDHIAWGSDGQFNVHLWEMSYCKQAFSTIAHSYMTHIVPTIVNFVFVRRYVRSVRKGEVLALKSVEVAYIVADKLANYALDDAEKCLRSGESFHEFFADIRKPLSRVLENLKSYKAFLPNALFENRMSFTNMRSSSIDSEKDRDISPNSVLCNAMSGKEVSLHHIESAVNHLRDRDYTLESFQKDMVGAFPELELHTHIGDKISSGRSGMEEYKRTLGAFYAVYSLLRLDIDGKEVFSFGVDDHGKPRAEAVGVEAIKKQSFYEKMPWHTAASLLVRAGLLKLDEHENHYLRKDRVAAMLALTAIHDIMKNTALLPFVHPRHAPYKGYTSNERIHDHDVALGYILEHFPTLLPSFKALQPGQRAPIFFTQGKMDFNNGWFVQGEAPPGALFSRFKEVIMEGRAAKSDISFYFVHWLTDLAGAEVFSDGAWPGAEKFTVKFPVKVLTAFLESFGFVDRLAVASEVTVMEDYLESRWRNIGVLDAFPMQMDIAVMRLALMAQGFESDLMKSLGNLSQDDCIVLSEELARTGCNEQFRLAPTSVQSNPSGPALLIYYSPALLQKAGKECCTEALHILACVCRAARVLFPLDEDQADRTVTIRIDEMKVLSPMQIVNEAPWYLRRTSGVDAEAIRGKPLNDEGAMIQIEVEEVREQSLSRPKLSLPLLEVVEASSCSGFPSDVLVSASQAKDTVEISIAELHKDPSDLCCSFGCACTRSENKEQTQFKHVLCV